MRRNGRARCCQDLRPWRLEHNAGMFPRSNLAWARVSRSIKIGPGMEKKQDALATTEAAAIAAISAAFGFPAPPLLARNILAATSSLVVASLAIPTAWLEGIALNIKSEATARAKVTAGAVPAVVDKIRGDAELTARATTYLGGRMLREQSNRESVVIQALGHLQAEAGGDPAARAEPAEPIDEDWLNVFGKLAESRSGPAMQAYFARILSGEIRRPGSFSPATLDVLSRLGTTDAESFQRLCALTTDFRVPTDFEGAVPPRIIAEPYGSPGDNSLGPLGFSYLKLCALQEAGLIPYDLTAWSILSPAIFLECEIRVGSTSLRFLPTPATSASPERRAKCINLTRAGQELFRIANVETNSGYVDKLAGWIEASFRLKLASRVTGQPGRNDATADPTKVRE